jgi:hypothetical protein
VTVVLAVAGAEPFEPEQATVKAARNTTRRVIRVAVGRTIVIITDDASAILAWRRHWT